MNVFDWPGPEFLEFYTALVSGGILLGVVVRWLARVPADLPEGAPPKLDPYEVAYLAAGPRGAIDTAVTTLVHRGLIAHDHGAATFRATQPAAHIDAPFERVVHERIARGAGRIEDVRGSATDAAAVTDAMARRLRGLGLVFPEPYMGAARVAPTLIMLPVLLVGLTKLVIGLSRDKPVAKLVIFCVIAAVATIAFLHRPVTRTRRGDKLLRRLRSRNQALKASVTSAGAAYVAPGDLALAVGLFGYAAIAHGPLADLGSALRAPGSSGDAALSWGWSADGGGDGGDGGGDCGGCGGCGGD